MNKLKLLAGTGLLAAGLVWMASCSDDDSSKPTVTVTTAEIVDISTTFATGGGSVEVTGGTATITARGVCWSENHSPTTTGSKTTDGDGTGDFTSSLTGLFNNTTYYVRAYAVSNGETVYGDEVSFATSEPIELIVNGDFALPAGGDDLLATAEPWETDETDAEIIGRDEADYKGHTGYVWVYDWAKSFYQTVGDVPAVETEYDISFDYTCTWNAWGDYKPTTSVIFSAYEGSDPSTREVIGTVDIDDPEAFPGWDNNVWGTKTGSFTLTAAQAAAAAGKHLVIEIDVLHYDDGANFSDVWYNFDNISVKQL